MAEAFCNTYAPAFDTMSAGTGVPAEYENQPISLFTERVVRSMSVLGIEMAGRKTKSLTPAMAEGADKIIALHSLSELPDYVKSSSKLEVWNVPDAANTDEAFHATIRDVIRSKIKDLIQQLSAVK